MDPISRTVQRKMPFQLSGFQIWAAGHFTLPSPKDNREPQLSHHTLTHLDLLSVLHESYSWCLVYCTSVVSISEQFIAASLPHGTLIKFKATWCDFNLNVSLMCFPFILLWCALSREMLQAQICPLSCFSVLLPGFAWWMFLNKNCCSGVKCALGTRVYWVILQGGNQVLGFLAVRSQKSSHQHKTPPESQLSRVEIKGCMQPL